jgi:hypothetical protein
MTPLKKCIAKKHGGLLLPRLCGISTAIGLLVTSAASAEVEDIGRPATAIWNGKAAGGADSFGGVDAFPADAVHFAQWPSEGSSADPRVGNVGDSEEYAENNLAIDSTLEYNLNQYYSSSTLDDTQFPSAVKDFEHIDDAINNIIGTGYGGDVNSMGAPGYWSGIDLSSPLTLLSNVETEKKHPQGSCANDSALSQLVDCAAGSVDLDATSGGVYQPDQQSFLDIQNSIVGAGDGLESWRMYDAQRTYDAHAIFPILSLYMSDVSGPTLYLVDGGSGPVFDLTGPSGSPDTSIALALVNSAPLVEGIESPPAAASVPELPVRTMLLIGLIGIALGHRKAVRPLLATP